MAVAVHVEEVYDDAAEAEERNLTSSEDGLASVEAIAPSAPLFEAGASAVELAPETNYIKQPVAVASLYPNLQEMRIKETATLDVVHSPAKSMLPLSREQLAQFYRVDGEMALAESFEAEFLARELDQSDQCTNHPLYQLLRRYAKARADLSLNMLEFDALRRKCKVLATELWITRDQTFTGTNTCGDGNLLRASCQGR